MQFLRIYDDFTFCFLLFLLRNKSNLELSNLFFSDVFYECKESCFCSGFENRLRLFKWSWKNDELRQKICQLFWPIFRRALRVTKWESRLSQRTENEISYKSKFWTGIKFDESLWADQRLFVVLSESNFEWMKKLFVSFLVCLIERKTWVEKEREKADSNILKERNKNAKEGNMIAYFTFKRPFLIALKLIDRKNNNPEMTKTFLLCKKTLWIDKNILSVT